MRYVLEATGADLLSVEIDGDVTVHNSDTQRSIPLGATATDVLALCDGTMDVDAISRLLSAAFGDKTNNVAVSVNAAVDLLMKEALIRRVETVDAH